MKKENPVQFTPEQLAQIAKVAMNLFNQISLEDFNQFLLLYAWEKAEQDEPAEKAPFYAQSHLEVFCEGMCQALPVS